MIFNNRWEVGFLLQAFFVVSQYLIQFVKLYFRQMPYMFYLLLSPACSSALFLFDNPAFWRSLHCPTCLAEVLLLVYCTKNLSNTCTFSSPLNTLLEIYAPQRDPLPCHYHHMSSFCATLLLFYLTSIPPLILQHTTVGKHRLYITLR